MSIRLESQPAAAQSKFQSQLRLRLRCSLLRILVLFFLHSAVAASVVVVMNDAAFGRVFCLDGTIYKTQTLAATQRDTASKGQRQREQKHITQSDLNGLCQAE